ncbi:hypothetical protein GIY23_18590 [Allosaccharopolyspora coralli]|uniref:DUF4345 domain-containing protein n=1 Tax=Allosaccharopolyspora coralli TaxID=2665642 RepID=A0A5Q3Q9V5_9PSEU|nr:hypothetical protein [Allosaccharopolyspora coralli]QGK71262.1 hypothetical protein GIY23_18590 [Allosaccharopolyspora coralli]
MSTEIAPRSVRLAGWVAIAQSVAGLAFVLALVTRGLSGEGGGVGAFDPAQTFGEAGYFTVLSGGVLAAGIGLTRSKHWARTPVLLLQLLLLGAAWYALGPSERALIGMLIAVTPIVVLWLLFRRDARTWTMTGSTAPDADLNAK